MAHVVTAAAVQVTAGPRSYFLETGAVLPEGVADDVIERLVDEGMIAEIEPDSPTEPTEPTEPEPYKGVSVADLKVVLAKRNEGRAEDAKIVPAEPGNRAEIVAALVADDAKQ